MLIPIGFLGAGGAAGAYELISSSILGSSATSVTFDTSSLSAYKHLQVRMTARSDRASSGAQATIVLNNDTAGTNWSYHILTGSGSGVGSSGFADTNGYVGTVPASTIESNVFAGIVFDLLDFGSTSKNKTIRSFSGYMSSTGKGVNLNSTAWRNTAAVTSLKIECGSAANFITGSRFSLYGIVG